MTFAAGALPLRDTRLSVLALRGGRIPAHQAFLRGAAQPIFPRACRRCHVRNRVHPEALGLTFEHRNH